MRLRRVGLAIAAVLGAATLTIEASAAQADGLYQPPGGATISAEVHLPGFETPAAVWQDPCGDDEIFTEFYSTRDDRRYKNDTHEFFDTQIPVPGVPGDGEWEKYSVYDGSSVDWVDVTAWSTPVKTHVHWLSGCRDPITSRSSPTLSNAFWVPLVTQDTVVPDLYAYLEDYLQPPAVSWPSMDPQFGWLYVKAAMDFRVAPPNAISLTATVTNVTGSVTASVSASPTSVTISPGEPGGQPFLCSLAAATADYSDESPGACSYTYQNSSAISSWGEFPWQAILRWDVTTSSPTFSSASIPTVSYGSVAVAEAQAVVTR
jgi:hypothetical protein